MKIFSAFHFATVSSNPLLTDLPSPLSPSLVNRKENFCGLRSEKFHGYGFSNSNLDVRDNLRAGREIGVGENVKRVGD